MQKIPTTLPRGIVVDIDDTLSESALTCAEAVLDEFPESTSGETAASLIEQYRQPGFVPQWQQPEIQERIAWYFNDESFISSLSLIEGALEGVQEIDRAEQLSFYITSRPESLQAVTRAWLDTHGFPGAPLLTRNAAVTDPDWKLRYLVEHYPEMSGLIDDSWQPLVANKPGFKGKLIFLERYDAKPKDSEQIHWVKDWQEIVKIVSKQ